MAPALHNRARMRRAWLLALVAAPAVAAAQITFDNGRTFPNYINAAECAGGSTIKLSWTVAFVNGFTAFPVGGTYQVYAANQPHVSPTCFTAPNSTTGLVAGPVGTQITGTGQSMAAQVLDTGQFVTASGRSCSTAGDQTIYVCVQGTPSGGGSNFGFATGNLTLSVSPPPAPINVNVSPGDSALNVSWDPGVATTAAPADSQEYVVEATVVGTTPGASDPTPVHTSGRVTAEDLRFSGLVNNVIYAVRVFAFSKAGNESAASDPVEGMPEPVADFWDAYKNAGGREQGGCASGAGAAGALGLLLAAASLVVLRRRK